MAVQQRMVRLYPKTGSPAFDPRVFRRPPAVYRGTPFWSWNTHLDIPQLLRQIDQFREMGFGGFHIHSRTGLTTPYLGDEFMRAVAACTAHAKRRQMLCWLYDEDRWPSGAAGGLVTRDAQYRTRHLLWTATPYRGSVADACPDERAAGTRSENGTLIGRYEIVLKDGRLAHYRRLKETQSPRRGAAVWYAYLETSQPSSWFNNQTYVDTFSRRAIERFIEVTHERYAETVGREFGKAIPAIFTDEPQFPKKTMFLRADEQRDIILPFTTDFLETFAATYGQRLEDHLPELFWDLPDARPSLARWRYHDHTAERFAEAFGDTLGRWCDKHGIALTGHLLAEADLFGQTRGVGEVMRAMRSFHIPGIDILCDRIEFTTAKQAQSLAHQYNRPAVVSELYGVTNWDFDFAGHKRQGDWQAALGVTVRVPHLAWVSMAGESKRDYPAAIGYQSPWYREYPLIEDHFARVNAVLTCGRPVARIGMIHPIESYWLCWGPVEHNRLETEERETAFKSITTWLTHGLFDWNYISEALLPGQCPKQPDRPQLVVGAMKYDAVVVPSMRTIRSTTLDRLERFTRAGGTVIFAGEIPSLVDARPSPRAQRLAKKAVSVPFTRRAIVEALAPFREIGITHADGSPADSLVHQLRIDGRLRHLFVCNIDKERPRPNTLIRVRGRWDVTYRDTFTGTSRPLAATIDGRDTLIPWSFDAHGHLLVTLTPGGKAKVKPAPVITWTEAARLADPVPVTLSEPNVLLLDQAEWRLDDGDWRPAEEILRIDNLARRQLNLPLRGGRIAQPWTDTDPAPAVATLQLRFVIRSEVTVAAPQLALENAAQVSIRLNGQPVESNITGWWVDEAIQTVRLPDLPAGEHELLLSIPFGRKTDVEWCYLLGDFGVRLAGRHATLTAPVRSLAWGDWTPQGLPFYAGNVTYHCTYTAPGRRTLLEVPHFRNPLLSVALDGKPAGRIAFAPYQLDLGALDGQHRLDITAYGNRHNAFGPLHHTNEKLSWVGPAAWRSEGTAWSYEYHFKRMGVLAAPIVKTTS